MLSLTQTDCLVTEQYLDIIKVAPATYTFLKEPILYDGETFECYNKKNERFKNT